MEKEFVPYAESLELKELGFDEPCLGAWAEHGFMTPNDVSTLQDDVTIEDIENTQDENMCLSPLYQQAFRWFREKYKLQGYVYSTTVRGTKEIGKTFSDYCWYVNGIDIPFLKTDARDMERVTYEEAELACLRKLIDLTKEILNEKRSRDNHG